MNRQTTSYSETFTTIWEIANVRFLISMSSDMLSQSVWFRKSFGANVTFVRSITCFMLEESIQGEGKKRQERKSSEKMSLTKSPLKEFEERYHQKLQRTHQYESAYVSKPSVSE